MTQTADKRQIQMSSRARVANMTETATIKQSPKLGVCEVCGAQVARYACPKCEVRTCTLPCVNIHKKELNCSGIRDPTKFIPLNKFTSLDLLNDYRMLEQANRVVETLHKNKPTEYRGGRRILPKVQNLTRLKAALHRHNTDIKFLPESFQKRVHNKTYLSRTKNLVFWDIEWVFANAAHMKIIEHGCNESKSLIALLHKYLSGEELKNKISFYQSAGASGIVLLLKAESVPGNKYYELEPLQSIQENLSGKIIMEYPTILVVLKGHESMYDIITGSEERPVSNTKRQALNEGDAVITHLLNEAAREDQTTHKNLLFITEYSDAELSSNEEDT